MTDELNITSQPDLDRPVLVAAFRGWNDGAQGASLAGGYLAKVWHAERFATLDPEGFYDFQATRPHVSLVEGLTRRVEWPENAFYFARPRDLGRDAVLLLGIEPNLRWRTFTGLVVDLARDLGVELVVTLGALLADVPHTRPSPVTGTATDPELIELPSVSLWAAVPHYASLAPSPRAALALLNRLGHLLDATIETGELEEAADAYTQQVSEAVATDEETAAYVEELEQRTDQLGVDEEELPTGDSIAAELTRFLREREAGNGGPNDPPREQ
jgi:proteasome assembly chaperone (PAC2) family protein